MRVLNDVFTCAVQAGVSVHHRKFQIGTSAKQLAVVTVCMCVCVRSHTEGTRNGTEDEKEVNGEHGGNEGMRKKENMKIRRRKGREAQQRKNEKKKKKEGKETTKRKDKRQMEKRRKWRDIKKWRTLPNYDNKECEEQ